MMQMVMSNPNLFMQMMQQFQSQSQGGQMFQQNPQYGGMNTQFGGSFMPPQQNQQAQFVYYILIKPTINFDNPPQQEEVQKDLFKDIYSYSASKPPKVSFS